MFNIDVQVQNLKIFHQDNIIGFEFTGNVAFKSGGMSGSMKFFNSFTFSSITTIIQNPGGNIGSAFQISMVLVYSTIQSTHLYI